MALAKAAKKARRKSTTKNRAELRALQEKIASLPLFSKETAEASALEADTSQE